MDLGSPSARDHYHPDPWPCSTVIGKIKGTFEMQSFEAVIWEITTELAKRMLTDIRDRNHCTAMTGKRGLVSIWSS